MRTLNAHLVSAIFGTLVLGCAHVKETPTQKGKAPICINALEQLPVSWRPSMPLTQTLDHSKWTSAEKEDAHAAVWSGLEEMIDYQEQNPTSVADLWDNSVEAYIDVAYGAAHQPKLRDRALDIAVKHFDILWAPYEKKQASINAMRRGIDGTHASCVRSQSVRKTAQQSKVDGPNQTLNSKNQPKHKTMRLAFERHDLRVLCNHVKA